MKIFITTIFFIAFALSLNVRLKADVITDYNLNVDINNDLSAQLDFNILLQNTSTDLLISSYSIDLPFKITSVNANLEGQNVNVILDSTESKSNIKFDFLTNVIKANQRAKLSIQAFTTKALTESLNVKQFYLPYPSGNYTYIAKNITVSYPVDFGTIAYNSEYKSLIENVNDKAKLTLKQTAPILLMWGNPELELSLNTQIENRKDSINHSLISLVREFPTQSIDYINIFKADYALADNLDNVFAFLTIGANSKIDLNSKAIVKINSSEKDSLENSSNSWELNLNTVLGQQIYTQINQGNDNLEKLNSLNSFIFQKYGLDTNAITFESLNTIWNENLQNLNSLQYCKIISATAKYLDLKSNIRYGYRIFDTLNGANPSIWCSVQVDNKIYNFDFESQKRLGFASFAASNIDRVIVGTWSENQPYNNVLGVLSNSPMVVQISELQSNFSNSLKPLMKVEFPNKVFSGEFYSGKIEIQNPTSGVLKINSLKVNNEDVSGALRIGELSKAIMPLQSNSFKIEYLRESDFSLNLSKKVLVDAVIDNNSYSESINITFEPDYKLLAITIVVAVIAFILTASLVVKAIKRKK
jgi:hypothetical protein